MIFGIVSGRISKFEVLTLRLEISIVDSSVEGAILVFRSLLGGVVSGFLLFGHFLELLLEGRGTEL